MKEHFKKSTFLFLAMLLSFIAVQAQKKNNPDGFVNNGGTLLLQERSLMASVGEPIVGLSFEGAFHCLQGFVYKTIPLDFKTDVDNLNLNNKLEVKVFPNPASDYLQVELKHHVTDAFNYTITSLNGSKVKNGMLSGELSTIDLTAIISASYVLMLSRKEGGEAVYTTLFIKQ